MFSLISNSTAEFPLPEAGVHVHQVVAHEMLQLPVAVILKVLLDAFALTFKLLIDSDKELLSVGLVLGSSFEQPHAATIKIAQIVYKKDLDIL